MSAHQTTGTIHFEGDGDSRVAVATVACSCGHTATSSHVDDPDGTEAEQAAENAAWDEMAQHLGYDPRDTPTGPENTSNTD